MAPVCGVGEALATFARVDQGLAALDWVLLAVYGAVVVGIGVWANRRQKSTEDYTLGGRRMRWWAVGVSLIATSFSSAALIGGTGFGFQRGMGYLQLQLGDLVAVAAACALFVPFFSRLRITTAYEYLERRFGVGVRTLASLLFIGQTLLRAGVLVFGPATALSIVLGWDIEVAIVVTGASAVLYSAIGGLAAVVWTDLIQFAVVVVGVTASVIIVAGDVPGGLDAVLSGASAADRLDVVDWGLSPSSPFSVIGSLFAYGALALSVAGTNQQAVQRYLSCRDARSATRAAFLGWAMGFVAVALTLFLGVCLAQWAELVPDAASGFTADVTAGGGDAALPAFIVHRLPAGLAGLLVAAIFAASMSSMDSAIHSMSTAALVDFAPHFRKGAVDEARDLRLARILTVVFGVAATAAGLAAATSATLMLDTLLRWLGYFAGPLLGVFLLGVLTERSNEPGALLGMILGGGVVFLLVFVDAPAALAFHPLWLAPLGCALTVLGGIGCSLLWPAPVAGRVTGLTWSTRPRSGRG